jgi:hypothetical protein
MTFSSWWCKDIFLTLFKVSYVTYVLTLFFTIIAGGVVTRFYGDTCGIDFFTPTTWWTSIALMGSPLCRYLNWIGQVANTIVESIWLHMMTVGLITLSTRIPRMVSTAPPPHPPLS